MPETKKTDIAKSIIIAVVVLIAFNHVVRMYYASFNPATDDNKTNTNKDIAIDERLRMASETINKTCPQPVDSFTILESTIAVSNQTFVYNFKTKTETNKLSIASLKDETHRHLLNYTKTNPVLKDFREMQVAFICNYSDDKGKPFI